MVFGNDFLVDFFDFDWIYCNVLNVSFFDGEFVFYLYIYIKIKDDNDDEMWCNIIFCEVNFKGLLLKDNSVFLCLDYFDSLFECIVEMLSF